MNIIECIEGHYEVQKATYGETYVWCPAHVVVECDCGQRKALTDSDTICGCGADYAALVREALAHQRHHILGRSTTISGVRSRASTFFRRKPTVWS